MTGLSDGEDRVILVELVLSQYAPDEQTNRRTDRQTDGWMDGPDYGYRALHSISYAAAL